MPETLTSNFWKYSASQITLLHPLTPPTGSIALRILLVGGATENTSKLCTCCPSIQGFVSCIASPLISGVTPVCLRVNTNPCVCVWYYYSVTVCVCACVRACVRLEPIMLPLCFLALLQNFAPKFSCYSPKIFAQTLTTWLCSSQNTLSLDIWPDFERPQCLHDQSTR